MSYATTTDLQQRIEPQALVDLADDNGDGIADEATLEALLEDASSEVDLFLSARYATPIAAPPDVLRRFAGDIAIHGLFARKRMAVSPDLAARYANTIKALSEIAAGNLSLPGVTPLAQCESTRTEEEKKFSAERLEMF